MLVIIFPAFYFGQIYEARHQPGTVAYSPQTVWNILEETCDELNRNGIDKIILVNGHGGNSSLLPYFCQAQLEKQKKYAVKEQTFRRILDCFFQTQTLLVNEKM